MKEWVTVLRAADAAARWHVHQRRKGSAQEPYVNHLLEVASLVAEATSAPQQTLIAEAVDLVVFVDQESGLAAGRKVREVAFVTGYREGRYQVEYV